MKFKIPTIFALSLIITVISLGLVLFSFQKNKVNALKSTSNPKEIKVLNLSDTSAAITWQTDLPVEGEIVLSDSKTPRTDDRDLNSPSPHTTHFVTLRNLTQNTKYSYKIKSGDFSFPDYNLEFKTAPKLSDQANTFNSKSSFIRGTILNTNLNPADETLIILKIEGAQDLGTVTSTSGNFILPLGNILSSNLANKFNISSPIPASLLIQRSSLLSNIDLTLPLKDQNLPPLTLGQNLNLDDILASPSASLSQRSVLVQVNLNIYDLNTDGVVNALDASIITDNINRRRYVKKSDLNNDAKVDQTDLDQILQALQ